MSPKPNDPTETPAAAPSTALAQAIRAWHLASDSGTFVGATVRRWPPEGFLDAHARLTRRIHARFQGHADESDSAAALFSYRSSPPDFPARRPWPGRPPPGWPPIATRDIESLARVGEANGPSIEEAVDILQRARGGPLEMEAAGAAEVVAVAARGDLAEPLALECAYLLASNGHRLRALLVLEGSLLVLEGSLASTPRPIETDLLRREAEFWVYTRRRFPFKVSPPAPDAAPGIGGEAPTPLAFEERTELPLSVERLRKLGEAGAPSADQVVLVLRDLRGHPLALRAVQHVLRARLRTALRLDVREACAELLAELGYPRDALTLLDDGEIATGALLAAPPALHDAEGALDVDAADEECTAAERAGAAERILATDLDAFGVRERHTRFRAVARAARLTVDVFRSLGGKAKTTDLRGAARSLEETGDAARAAELLALAGDHVEKARLGVPPKPAASAVVPLNGRLAELDDLDARGLRLAAVARAKQWLRELDDTAEPWGPEAQSEIAAFARGILARLLRGPCVDLLVDGELRRYALGPDATVGRAGATIALASPAVSRVHLRLWRRDGSVVVEDAQSHNGTWLAGARLRGPLAVTGRLELTLAETIACAVSTEGDQSDGPVVIEVAGQRVIAALGPLRIGGVEIALARRDDEDIVTLRPVGPHVVAHLDVAPRPSPLDHALSAQEGDVAIELARGDVVRVSSPAPLEICVLRSQPT